MPTREIMDVREAADYLGISIDTLYNYAAAGYLPAFKLGNRWRFTKQRLDEWMALKMDVGKAAQELRNDIPQGA